MNKYCRICWNSKHWHEPTAEAASLETEGSYVSENGFGHEEWLFRFSWQQPGPKDTKGLFKYGFLQPIGKYHEKYIGIEFDVLLYTITPEKQRLAVGVIRKLFVPSMDEISQAFDHWKRKGWFKAMRSELGSLELDSRRLGQRPEHFINVRFRQENVEFFEPRRLFPDKHKINKASRYHPFNWDKSDDIASWTRNKPKTSKSAQKSEHLRTRASIEGTVYSPAHNILQNALYKHLCKQYDDKNVDYETEFVDLKLRHNKHEIFFEIKIALTAKRCIRDAIGQLLEYSIYPSQLRASKLVVVGENDATPDDSKYLALLRDKYGIPIRYIKWNHEAGRLAEEL